jgi:hypothetical protein
VIGWARRITFRHDGGTHVPDQHDRACRDNQQHCLDVVSRFLINGPLDVLINVISVIIPVARWFDIDSGREDIDR